MTNRPSWDEYFKEISLVTSKRSSCTRLNVGCVLVKDNRIHYPKKVGGNPYKKIYLHEHPGKPCTDLWDDIHSISQGKELRKYPTTKPIKLLERLVSISTDEGDVVYDPMCGSGTTGGACNNLKRKCVLNDANLDVVPVIKSRFS